jgi:peptidoglycan/xylan/chitin deacetylase (PgdA/CDA1 family)
MYHRVADADFDPWKLAVSPRRFDSHMRAVNRLGSPMSLGEMLRRMGEDALPPNAVAVTFDDGYSDNLFHAKPVLEKHGVPATVFVTSGYIGGEREFWWDELERMVFRKERLPETLNAEVDGAPLRIRVGSSKRARMRAYFSLWEKLHPLSGDERDAALSRLRRQAGDDGRPRGSHRPMTKDELKKISAGGLVEIGGHTATHPALATLSRAEQKQEIRAGKVGVEAALGRPITSFSYPHGSLSPETVEEVESAGFDVACMAEPEVAKDAARPHEMPRVMVKNFGGKPFELWLSRLIGG